MSAWKKKTISLCLNEKEKKNRNERPTEGEWEIQWICCFDVSKSSRSIRIEYFFSFGPNVKQSFQRLVFNSYCGGDYHEWAKLGSWIADNCCLCTHHYIATRAKRTEQPTNKRNRAHRIQTTMSNKSLPIVSLHHLLFFPVVSQQIRCRQYSQYSHLVAIIYYLLSAIAFFFSLFISSSFSLWSIKYILYHLEHEAQCIW